VVGAGIVLGQAILYGPSLIGEKILLPLDLLTLPGYYIPSTAETVKIVPHNIILSDLVVVMEPARQFAIRKFTRAVFLVGALSIWRRSVRVAEIFGFSPFGMPGKSR